MVDSKRYKFTGYVNSLGYLISSERMVHPIDPNADVLALYEFDATNRSGTYTVEISFINGHPEYECISISDTRIVKKFKNVFKITMLPTERELLNRTNNP